MSLSAGERLGPYEIRALLGAGGMGEVYRARDTKLDRDVAIKVLPAAMARDPERLARFDREAKVLAALNHPNIAAIYGLEDRAIVMELVEGPTLAERLQAGPLELKETLSIASAIADALDAAHERGVVHRDLKPANVKAPPDGTVKVLDLGLATALPGGERGSSDAANSPTLTMGATEVGVILGTAAYMSPEQASGKRVDRRADIWSFGVVLWEMLTGARLFEGGDTVSHTLADVLRAPIDFDKLPTKTPAVVRELLQRCLDRDVKTRLRDIGEARILIQKYLANPGETSAGPRRDLSAARRVPWVVAIAALLIALVLAFLYFRRPSEEAQVMKLSLPLPEKAILTGQTLPAVSPDGRHVAFTATLDGKTGLWVRDFNALGARLLPGTDGALFPFWSPDSRAIGFFADGKLKKIEVAGGPTLTLCEAGGDPRGGTWSKDGVILFIPDRVSGGSIFRVSEAGGAATLLLAGDRSKGEAFRFPWFLPDGRHFLYLRRVADITASMIYAGDLDSKTGRPVIAATSNAVYAAGHLLYTRERTLMAQPFDPAKLRASGEAVPIAEQVDYVTVDQRAHFSSSENGVLAYVSGGVVGGASHLTWFERSGKTDGTVSAPGIVRWPAIAPDGRSIAFYRTDAQVAFTDIWLHDLARGTDSRFTFGPGASGYPVWSPDSSRLAFVASRDGSIYQKATGVAQEEPLDKGSREKRPLDWSRDGRFIVEEMGASVKTGNDIWILPLSGDRKPFPYLQTEFNERWAKLSPGGQWLAYSSDETKRNEVYVQTFPKPGGKWQVSTNGGDRPVWSRDGKELYFISADGKLMAAEVRGGSNLADFNAGVPKPLFDVRISPNDWFDVGKDGRFLIPTTVAEQLASVPLTVIANWPAGLRK
jgi:Tol biopolymer transport system component